MLPFIPPPGMATTIVDFTTALSPLLVGLVSLVWLAAAAIAYEAIYHLLRRPLSIPTAVPPFGAHPKAA